MHAIHKPHLFISVILPPPRRLHDKSIIDEKKGRWMMMSFPAQGVTSHHITSHHITSYPLGQTPTRRLIADNQAGWLTDLPCSFSFHLISFSLRTPFFTYVRVLCLLSPDPTRVSIYLKRPHRPCHAKSKTSHGQ